jgi:hypothetical protein
MPQPRSHLGSLEADRGEVVVDGKRIDITIYEDGAVRLYVNDVTGRWAIEDFRGAASEANPYVGVVLIPR